MDNLIKSYTEFLYIHLNVFEEGLDQYKFNTYCFENTKEMTEKIEKRRNMTNVIVYKK